MIGFSCYYLKNLRRGKMMDKIIIKDLCMCFGKLRVLSDIFFNIKENEFVSIIGPSGCGKTTLLYIIQGLIKQTSGEIISVGKKGFVFQDHNLFPWKTIKENILIGSNNLSNIDLILKNMGLSKFSNFYPSQVSEGMKQRAGIGRCLAYDSDILLLDEPFCSLDYFSKIKVQEFLLKLWKERKLTILFVTHDIEEAIRLSNKIVVLSKLPAKVMKIIEVDKNKSDAIKKEILDLIQKAPDSVNYFGSRFARPEALRLEVLNSHSSAACSAYPLPVAPNACFDFLQRSV